MTAADGERPVLSYQRQDSAAQMRWVVWWIGLYLVAQAGSSLLGLAWRWHQFSVRLPSVETLSEASPLLLLLAGIGIMQRWRYAFAAAILLAALQPVSLLRHWEPLAAMQLWQAVGAALHALVVPAAAALALNSVYRRALQRGVLLPAAEAAGAADGHDASFLLKRVGWYWAAFAGHLIVYVCFIHLWPPSPAEYRPYLIYTLASSAGRSLCGLLMMLGSRQGLLVLTILLCAELPVNLWVRSLLGSGPRWDAYYLGRSILHTAAVVLPLLLLYRRLQERGSEISSQADGTGSQA